MEGDGADSVNNTQIYMTFMTDFFYSRDCGRNTAKIIKFNFETLFIYFIYLSSSDDIQPSTLLSG